MLVVDHPVVAHRLSVLRDVETDNATFRTLVGELSAVVAYEALRDLRTADHRVDTPVASDVACQRVSEMVLLVPILRGGLGMIPAIQEVLPLTEVAQSGCAARREHAPTVYLDKIPSNCRAGGSSCATPCWPPAVGREVCDLVKQRGASRDPRALPDRVGSLDSTTSAAITRA